MRQLIGIVLVLGVGLGAQGKEEDRLRACATVMEEVLAIPDDIPADLLDKAECVIVFPGVKKVAVGVGGRYGRRARAGRGAGGSGCRGAMTCRTGADFSGTWSAPTLMSLEGGSIGFQIGGQSTDFVLLVMNDRGATSVLGSKGKLGADAAAAAGPKGRTASAATDVVMQAEMLSYSRSRGLFAGVSLEGSTLRPDNRATQKLYGRKLSVKDILRKNEVGVPSCGQELVSTLNKHSPKNLSDKK